MARSDTTEFIIEILEGRFADLTFRLTGRELPYRAGAGGAISYGRTQRSKLTWYPGNRVASQQIIGPVLKPTTINGIWKERYLGTDRPIDLVEAFEDLLDSGAQVRVFWETIERQGIVKDFTWKPGVPTGGLTDIEWTCVFEWSAAGLPPPRRVGRGDLSLRSGLARAANGIATLGVALEDYVQATNTFVGLPKVLFQSTRREIRDTIEAFKQPLDALSQSAARSTVEPELPARFVEDSSDAAGQGLTLTSDVAVVTSGVFPGATTVADGLEAVLGDYLARDDLTVLALATSRDLFELRVRLEDVIRPPIFARITANPGTDLREVARRFYGSSDLWDRIAKQNGLEQSVVPDDVEVILVPLSLPDATDQKVGC